MFIDLLIDLNGFVFPLEWLIGIVVTILFLGLAIVYLALFRKPPVETPVEENLVALIPFDQFNNPQIGELIGNATRSDQDLTFSHPDWILPDTGERVSISVPIEKIMPLSFIDVKKALKKLWILANKGDHIEAISASTMMNNAPIRFDLPLADRRRLFRFLVGFGAGSVTAGKFLTSRPGIFIIFVVLFFGLMSGIIIERIVKV